ncbi:ABC transporter ATP-binding protein [Kitasatospora sp. RB6PN24]|uniref:ABC transporter ATP-binding protein n=1 Tax=Kitasatospora humi TaxID=2893891 RepID=UPI001E301C20|nr:ABC transporter ATP-binding protein [Kitasatospora humi]MCC9309086.1 ABC transporter ATP-binding protein [Kitasatospora humi]
MAERLEPLLRATDLRVSAGDVQLLAVPSATVPAGGCLGLVGVNGSGKSTLLKALAGLLRPDAGSVLLGGRPVREHESGFRRQVGVFLDDAACFPDLTVAEHVRMVATAHGLGPTAAERCERVLDLLGLRHRADARPDTLSAGQRQLLLLAAVLVRPARLLLLDEPEQRLDTGARGRLADALRTAVADGTAIVMAVHDRQLLSGLADQVLVLDGGRVVDHGPTAEVLDRGATPWN